MRGRILAIAAAILWTGGTAAAAPGTTAIPMKADSGVFVVPVVLDGTVTLDCIVDSGASDVNIPESVLRRLVRIGAVKDADYVGTREYELADGSSVTGAVIRIRALKVGAVVVRDVLASVGGDGDSGLLGQSFLTRFKSWSVDNARHALVLVGPVSPPEPIAPRRPLVGHGGPDPDASDAGPVAQTGRHAPTVSQSLDDEDGGPLAAQTGN